MLTHKLIAPKAVRTPKFMDFADKAFGSQKEQYPEIEPLLDWMEESIGVPDRAVIVVVDDIGDYVALILLDAHIGLWNQNPWVLFVYAEERSALQAVLDASVAWGRSLGFGSCQAINRTRMDDERYIQAMGYPGEVVGSLIRFDFKEDRHERR